MRAQFMSKFGGFVFQLKRIFENKPCWDIVRKNKSASLYKAGRTEKH